jgi:superfamily II DNA or RNA helicase
MKLRNWRSECIAQALEHFETRSHFFCQATPGAGKTTMSTELAAKLYEDCNPPIINLS